MKIKSASGLIFQIIIIITLSASTLYAQLNKTFERMFNQILKEDLFTDAFLGGNFDAAAIEANRSLTPALNSLIASNVSSFPLTSTVAGLSIDLSSGVPELIQESLGPIYAETAEMLGKGNLNIGFNYSHYDLTRLRGIATEDIRFTITSEDLSGDGTLGDILIEAETIDIFPDLNISASTFVFYATWGLAHNFDVGVAVPFISLSLDGRAKAVINSVSFFDFGAALNSFNNSSDNPQLVDTYEYSENVTGMGDLALRLKYRFPRGDDPFDLAVLFDIRFPTGKKEEFLSTGKINARFSWIMSRKFGNFTPHLNLGFEHRGADFDSGEFEFMVGFDQKLAQGITFVIDVLGEFDFDKARLPFPQKKTIKAQAEKNFLPPANAEIDLDLTNIPNSNKDNVLNASIGIRIAPSHRISFLANVLIPMNDGGLRSNVAPTVGLAVTF